MACSQTAGTCASPRSYFFEQRDPARSPAPILLAGEPERPGAARSLETADKVVDASARCGPGQM